MMAGCGGGGLQLEADSTGIYLLHHGTLTRYDHDLNKVASKEIMERPKMMHQGMQGRGMRGGQMQGQGRHMGGMMQGRGGQHAPIAQRRSIDDGEVTLGYLPTDLTTGQVDLRIHVLDINGEYDQDANVSAFLYPQGNPGMGKDTGSSNPPRRPFSGYDDHTHHGHMGTGGSSLTPRPGGREGLLPAAGLTIKLY